MRRLLHGNEGIKVIESRTNRTDDFINTLTVKVLADDGENVLVGTVFGKNEPRLVRLNTFRLEALPAGPMLLVFNNDVPGVIGALGTELGRAGVNISRMTVGREETSNQNIIFLGTDSVITDEVLNKVRGLANIYGAQALELSRYDIGQS
jgi:D-3-phosphoglycerate dehydrogenase